MSQDGLEPEEPAEAGVPETSPDAAQIEGAKLLAAHSRPRLKEAGFDESQIDKWAQAYVRERGAGDVEGFVAWVAEQESK